jgi:hypothetical protein
MKTENSKKYPVNVEKTMESLTTFLERVAKESNSNKFMDVLKSHKLEMSDIIAISPSKEKKEKKEKKDGPKRGKSSYIYFCLDYRNKIKEEHSDMNAKDITRELGKLWREISDKEKDKYIKLADKDKERYNNEKNNNEKGNKNTENNVSVSTEEKKCKKNIQYEADTRYLNYYKEISNNLKKEKLPITEKVTKIKKMWARLSEKEKEKYN